MKITSLVDNVSSSELKASHGLCFHIEHDDQRILFDLGNKDVLIKNAKLLNIDLSKVDIVVISHGHVDHGGGLKYFLSINNHAKVYVQRKAFESHYLKVLALKINIGLNKDFMENPQIILIDGDFKINDYLQLFTVKSYDAALKPKNVRLYENNCLDQFDHEQSLIISGQKTLLLMGCAHMGVLNILNEAQQYEPHYCIGGFHFLKIKRDFEDQKLLKLVTENLLGYNGMYFYTCHCTGMYAYNYLKSRLDNISYLSCGNTIEL